MFMQQMQMMLEMSNPQMMQNMMMNMQPQNMMFMGNGQVGTDKPQ
jgi:hypothetical protein